MSTTSSDQFIPSEVIDTGALLDAGDFGVYRLSVKEAAELVALDMCFSDSLEGIDVPEDCEDEYDPRLKVALAGVIAKCEQRLLRSIEHGRLITSAERRDLEDNLVPETTYISYRNLIEWLRARGYDRGDVIARWEENQAEIAGVVVHEAASLRALTKTGKRVIHLVAWRERVSTGQVDEADATQLRATLRLALAENHRLKTELAKLESGEPAKVDRPLEPRERRTLLVIIAALCGRAGIKYKEEGVPKSIEEATQEIEARVGRETIRRVLSEIPDALFSRRRTT